MIRRSFLGLLGLGGASTILGSQGSVLTPAMAPDVNQISSKYALSGVGMMKSSGPDIMGQLKYLREELSGLDDKEKYIAEYMAIDKSDMGFTPIDRIDPDLRAMKSFSEVTKVRMYYRRRAELRWEQRRNSVLSHIADLLKEKKDV